MRSPSRARLVVALALACLTPAVAGAFQKDEVFCEEAVAHLVACCPGLSPGTYSCDHLPAGCGPEVFPDLSLEVSQCLRKLSCEELQDGGWCGLDATTRAEACR